MKRLLKLETCLPILLITMGLGAVAVSLAADLLGIGGRPGFGGNQLKLALVGLAALLCGGFLWSPIGQRTICSCRQWADNTLQPVSASRILLWAVWFGLFTGLIEAGVLAIQIVGMKRIILLSPHLAWMAPVGETAYFCVIGLLLLGISRCLPKLFGLHTILFIYSLLCAFGVLKLITWFTRSQPYGRWILLIGIAVACVRILSAHANRLDTFFRRTTYWLAGLTVILALGVFGVQWSKERSGLAALPPATPNKPNVLFIVLDTVRAQNLSVYGHHRSTTPALEKLAKRSVVFDQAISTAPWTHTSHVSMFTGRYPHETSADWLGPLDDTWPTVAEVLSQQGYRTAGFVGNMGRCGHVYGIDRGFVHFEDYPVSVRMILESAQLARTAAAYVRKYFGIEQTLIRKSAATVNQNFLDWLPDQDQEQRPFFVFLNYFDAHDPYVTQPPYDTIFGEHKVKSLPSLWQTDYNQDELETLLQAYDASIAYADQQMALLFESLKSRGLLDNTLIIIVGDHGEEFYEHGMMGHGNNLYRTSLHVPLMISLPSSDLSARVTNQPVSLVELASTIMDLVGVEKQPTFLGQSLARFWQPPLPTDREEETLLLSEVTQGINTPDHFPVTWGDMQSLTTESMHYILNGNDTQELYDYIQDPQEIHNLIDTDQGAAAAISFRASLKIMLSDQP